MDITQLDPNNPQYMEILTQFQNQYTDLKTKVAQQHQILRHSQNDEIKETLAKLGKPFTTQTITNNAKLEVADNPIGVGYTLL